MRDFEVGEATAGNRVDAVARRDEIVLRAQQLDDVRDRGLGLFVATPPGSGLRAYALSSEPSRAAVHHRQPLQAQLCNHVAMFVGQSGVGKSTLTNRLAPESARATRTLSDSTGEGRHTTVSTALFKMPAGGELIDSPGVRDYAPPLVDDATVQVGWPEILTRAPQCRFNNCLHLREPGCAVTAAVTAGEVPPRRYESYKRLLNIMRGLAPEYERRR